MRERQREEKSVVYRHRKTRPGGGATSLALLACALMLSATVQAAVPPGWRLVGLRGPGAVEDRHGKTSEDYEAGVDRAAVYGGKPSAFVKSIVPAPRAYATLTQGIFPGKRVGKRVRLSAFVRAEAVSEWAGLWLRVDCTAGKACSFDNMQGRPIKGTSDWRRYEVVLDVPEEAVGLAFGVLLSGTGQVWINQVRLEEVDRSVPTTDLLSDPRTKAPRNLDFQE